MLQGLISITRNSSSTTIRSYRSTATYAKQSRCMANQHHKQQQLMATYAKQRSEMMQGLISTTRNSSSTAVQSHSFYSRLIHCCALK
jgi:hypothetical protein